MSYYYDYYIGYKKNGKIYPLGPYTIDGDIRPALSRSKSLASDLHEYFLPVSKEQVSEELRKEFEFENWEGEKVFDVKYITEQNLPRGSYIKTGYFLIDDVKEYEEAHFLASDIFYDTLTPQIYAAKLQHELMFGKNEPKKDCEGVEYTEHNASDYMYYAYPDFTSKEYEASILIEMLEAMRIYSSSDIEYVILETEG